MSRQFKAVTFDAGGTLIHLKDRVGDSYAKIAGEFGIVAEPGKLEAAFREIWSETPPPFQANASGCGETERQWWRTLVSRVFERALQNASFTSSGKFDLFFHRLYESFAEPGVWELDRDAGRVFKHLERAGIRMGIISNFDERLRRILQDLGVVNRFEIIVISNEVRFSKPDRRIFDHAIRKLRLPAPEIIHVGDDPVRDIGGAAAAGLDTFLVGRKHQPLIRLIDKLPLAQA